MTEGTNDSPANEAVRGASTLIELLDVLRDHGFGEQLIAQDDGTLRCGSCRAEFEVAEFRVEGFHRLEGASDPADMNIVVWGHCPGCDGGGVATIGYGPNSSDADEAVLGRLDLGQVDDEGSVGD